MLLSMGLQTVKQSLEQKNLFNSLYFGLLTLLLYVLFPCKVVVNYVN